MSVLDVMSRAQVIMRLCGMMIVEDADYSVCAGQGPSKGR